MASPDDSPEARRRGGRRWLHGILRIALTAGALALVLRYVQPHRTWALLSTLDPLLFGFVVCYTGLGVAGRPLRWLWLLRGVLPDTPYRTALASSLCGSAARLVLPGKVGELARVLGVPGLKPLPGAGLTALDLLMEAAAAFLLALPGALILGGPVAATAVIFLTALCLLILLRPHQVLAPLTRLPGLGGLRERLAGAQQVMENLGRPTLYRGLGLSVTLHLLKVAQLLLIFVALGVPPTAALVIFLPLIQLADGFPLTVGGLGAREWISVLVLPLCGVAPEAAVAAVLLQFLLTTALPGLAGGWLLLRRTRAVTG